MKKNLLLFSVVLSLCHCCYGQTNINGVVNTYHKVIEIIPAKSCVRVTSTAGLSILEKIMIIQMKGATVVNNNNSNFGDTLSLNNAGNYEINDICRLNGDTVFLFKDLLNSYTVAYKVQLVGIPTYTSAVVTDTLKASPWNNSTGMGGVLAIYVTQDLILNAPVIADASGYSGGGFLLSSGVCSNFIQATGYIYTASLNNPQNGGYKGEGVYDVASNESGGRGAPANGGGGGNNHNNGGGGGANLSAGGIGGGNSSTTGCTGNFRGQAGKALNNWNRKKIFPGGGGGAGHANGGLVNSWGGGNGGGIVFISTYNLTTNGHRISSNGQAGGPAYSDGASGGGAGGTIIIDVANSYSDAVQVNANGGIGGTEDNDFLAGRCYGAGGGGSGGAIYFSSASPAGTITVNGGTAGQQIKSDAGCNTLVQAGAGTNGIITNNYNYIRSLTVASYCASILPSRLLYFTANTDQQKVYLSWRVVNQELLNKFVLERSVAGGPWTQVITVPANAYVNDYSTTDNFPQPGINQYRLKLIEKSGQIFYSDVQAISIHFNIQYTVYPNPTTGKIIITGKFPVQTNFRMLSVTGKVVWQKKLYNLNQSVQFELTNIPRGTYSLHINEFVKKLVLR